MNDRSNRIKISLWLGVLFLAVFVLWGEDIASRFGWQFPDWLRALNGFVALLTGILLIGSAVSSLWRTGRKQ